MDSKLSWIVCIIVNCSRRMHFPFNFTTSCKVPMCCKIMLLFLDKMGGACISRLKILENVNFSDCKIFVKQKNFSCCATSHLS